MKFAAFCLLVMTVMLGGILYEFHFTRIAMEKLSADFRDDWQRNEAVRTLIKDNSNQLAKEAIRFREFAKKQEGKK